MKPNIYFLIISHSFLLTMRNISEKKCRENQNTFCVQYLFFPTENRAVYEIMWKNLVEPDRPKMAIRRMSIACWITGATDTPSKMKFLLLFLCNKGYANVPHVKFIRTLPVFFMLNCTRIRYCQMRTAERNKVPS